MIENIKIDNVSNQTPDFEYSNEANLEIFVGEISFEIDSVSFSVEWSACVRSGDHYLFQGIKSVTFYDSEGENYEFDSLEDEKILESFVLDYIFND